jgi:glycosyltransferase involved in cell wall biosynthesis
MRILKVWDGEYPWDVRAEKVCRGLTDAGHTVHMVARNRDGRVLREELQECTVHRLRPWRLFGSALDAASQFPAFFNPRWVHLMTSVGRREKVDLVLVRDLPLAPTAIYAARRMRVPVVLDMAENYPAMIRDLWLTGATRFGDSLVRNPRAVEAVERWCLNRIDHTLVVVEESRDRLLAMGVPPERITVVSNTPSVHRLDALDPTPRRAGGDGSPLEMVYLGLLETARGVSTAIDAVALCRERGIPVTFSVVGDGRARASFEARAAALGLGADRIRFHGFLPYEEALEIVARADVGLIPHMANESWNTTIPNKLFDYMAAGLPVLASDALPTRRVIEQTGCGVWFRSGDAEHLAQGLTALLSEPDRARRGVAGRDAIRRQFNWQADRDRMAASLEGLVQPSDPAATILVGAGPIAPT